MKLLNEKSIPKSFLEFGEGGIISRCVTLLSLSISMLDRENYTRVGLERGMC